MTDSWYRRLELEMPDGLRKAYWHLVGLLPTPVDEASRERQRAAIFRVINEATKLGEATE